MVRTLAAQTEYMYLLIILGFGFEALGLAIAAQGLWKTWEANAAGRDFLSPRARQAVNWVRYSLLRQRRPVVTIGLNATLQPMEATFSSYTHQEIDEGMTTDERLSVVQANALAALRAAANAQATADTERKAREREVARVEERLDGTERRMTEFAQTLVVDGIPLAVGGLGLVGVGLLLQTVASLLGVNP